jgi:diguanylate cyclase (GGDEF)-like protein
MSGERIDISSSRAGRWFGLRARLFFSFVFILFVPLFVALLAARVSGVKIAIVLGVAMVLGIPAAAILASDFSRPTRSLARLATRIVRGEYGAQADTGATGELAVVSAALNQLSIGFRDRVTDIDAYRDELRQSVRRLGEALRSTHDLAKMLSVVLETALVAVDGASGAVYLRRARGQELYVRVGRHLDAADAKKPIPFGQGLAGWVASSGFPVVVPSGEDGPVLADPEPIASTALAVPLETQSQLVGVLAIYGCADERSFDASDLETILSLARQAGVGIENVLLHEDAKRMSITDGLTGIWNYRYFQMTMQRDIERAMRRPEQLTLMVIDIDHFKQVNDQHGHQRGDAILIELAQRVLDSIRKIDFLARYGGEEFVIILPDTGEEGALTAAEKIRSAVADMPFGGDGDEPVPVTVSIGFAVHPTHGVTPQELLGAADKAMYEAKRRGRNRVLGADDAGGRRISLARDPAAP